MPYSFPQIWTEIETDIEIDREGTMTDMTETEKRGEMRGEKEDLDVPEHLNDFAIPAPGM